MTLRQAKGAIGLEVWETTVKLEFDKRSWKIKFLVGEDMTHPVLLGNPDMEMMDIYIKLRNKQIGLAHETPAQKGYVAS